MDGLNWRLRILVLWIFLGVADTVGLVLYLYRAETVRDVLSGEVEGVDIGSAQAQVYTAAGALVPLAMAFATLVLADRVARWANGVLGLLWAVTLTFLVLADLRDPLAGVLAAMWVASVGVLWHVWRWPAPDEAGSHTPRGHATRSRQVSR